jgi:lysophospholipase L1-like esterase
LNFADGKFSFNFMKILTAQLFACLLAATSVVAADVSSNAVAPIQISDVPRNTQMGNPPAPAGAPGGGKYFPPLPANTALPTLWLIGDSTVRNGTLGDGSNMNQWGWGAPIVLDFNLEKINVINRAFGGTSSRSFYNGFFWQNLRSQIKKGDFVIMQFGANDNGGATGKGALKGTGDETQDVARNGKTETVHTFGWYLQQFVKETREQGATPIICSLTPRKNWTADGHFRRDNTTHAAWAGEVAKDANVPFVDLYELIARKYESLGQEKVNVIYVPSPKENLHTGWDGAVINSECVIAGLNGLKENPLAPFLSARGQAIAPVVLASPVPAAAGKP